MTKKLLNASNQQNVTIDLKKIHKDVVRFDPPAYIRVCNASSKEPYKTPEWPSARETRADAIKSRGTPC